MIYKNFQNKVFGSKSVKINDVISVKHLPDWRNLQVVDFPKTRIGAKFVNNYIIEITNHKDLEILHQHEMVLRQNKNLEIKGNIMSVSLDQFQLNKQVWAR